MKLRRMAVIGLESLLLLSAITVLARHLIPAKAAENTAGSARPFRFTALDGAVISPTTFKGKALVVNYWAPWCPPCRLEIPWLQNLQNENAGKLRVIGVVADNSQYKNAASFMKAQGITYLVVQDTLSLEMVFGDPSSLPTTFYISPTGHVVHVVTGVEPQYVMRRYAQDAITQK